MFDLKLTNVSKRYRIAEETVPQVTGRRLLHRFRRPTTDFWAVRDVSFEVEHGQILGIIGHNGAGKSTLLKLLSGITAPTTGEMQVRGRLAALLEVGSGFHPELTGRENIFLSGCILGMSRQEIHNKLESIIDFAGIRQFIDVPVKRFSSGMYVRLGFSISAYLEPDVLLLDEVLAVGDAAFQEKCKQRVLALRDAGTTIVFISHDLAAVQSICDRVIVMQRGATIFDGDPASAINAYKNAGQFHAAVSPVTDRSKKVEITSVCMLDAAGCETTVPLTGEDIRIRVRLRVHSPVTDISVAIFSNTPERRPRFECSTHSASEQLNLNPGECDVDFCLHGLVLPAGPYHFDAKVENSAAGQVLDYASHCLFFQVHDKNPLLGDTRQPYTWNLVNVAAAGDDAALSLSHKGGARSEL